MIDKKKPQMEYQETQGIDFSDKKKAFMYLYSQQSKEVREKILSDLPAFHALLSLEAESFEELALNIQAEKRGVSISKDMLIMPDCPFCGTHKNVTKKTGYTYRCSSCNHVFKSNYNSISSGSKCDALTWMKVLQCIIDFISVSETCQRCGINKKTYYSIRNRLFYGIKLLMDRVKLYGEIQVDNTFVRVSFKGINLESFDYSEDSVFYEGSFKPRSGRKRGGSYSQADLNSNSICIYTAIDDRGHVLARFVGVGMANCRHLMHYISPDKFLLDVPEKDPFADLLKPQKTEPKSSPGDRSIMVADKEYAIGKHAKSLGLDFESHVYRKNNVQLQHQGESRNIQKVNALHRRLKDFLRKCNYVSSKYLPGYLYLFEFIENCAASPVAVQELFKILSTPNLGKPPSYYKDQYSVPNYLVEWLDDESVLKKIPYNKRLAYYLYDHVRNKENYPNVGMTMDYIEQKTGYTAPVIRKIYKDLSNAGYHQKILCSFGEPERETPQKKTIKGGPSTFNPIVLAIYDEYTKIRLLPARERPSFSDFLEEKNKQYGTCYKRTNMLAKFNKIEESGIRQQRPEYNKEKDILNDTYIGLAVTISIEYEDMLLKDRERGEKRPKKLPILDALAAKYGLTSETIDTYVRIGRKYRKEYGLG